MNPKLPGEFFEHQMARVNLSAFDNSAYSPGRPLVIQMLWFLVGLPLLRCPMIPFNGFRCALLRVFGARVGPGVVVKPGVRVKYPWLLIVGANAWLGEDCWIDNLVPVEIGANACVSQGAYLCTGNHDWSDRAFGLIAAPITVEEGAWVGARSVVCPGVTLGPLAILTAGSVAQKSIPASEIHSGNPAVFRRQRTLRDAVG